MAEVYSIERNKTLYRQLVASALEDRRCPGIEQNEERLAFVVKFVGSDKRSNSLRKPNATRKDSRISAEFRTQVDRDIESGIAFDFDKAVENCTKSLAYAPKGSREMSLAYASRSAVLFEASFFSDCLLDIDRALENNCPDDLKEKLYFSKALCIKNLKSSKKMNEKNQNLMEEMVDNQEPIHLPIFRKWDPEKLLPKVEGNPKIPGISDAIEVQHSERWGRHIVATKDIKTGEVLTVEKAYATVVSLDSTSIYCWNCALQVWASVPCENCVHVVFCSDDCRTEGSRAHHDVECPIIASIILLGTEVDDKEDKNDDDLMALRLLVKALKEQGNSIEKLQTKLRELDLKEDPSREDFTDYVLDSEDFSSVYRLKQDLEKKSYMRTQDLSNAIRISFLLAKHEIFFKSKGNEGLQSLASDGQFIFLVGLLEKLKSIIRINAFGTDRLCSKGRSENSFTIVAPVLSLFNHSCDPGSLRTEYGTIVINTASRPIKKGQQIFGSYGPVYSVQNRDDRQGTLDLYGFTCNCEACENDWPQIGPRTLVSDSQKYIYDELESMRKEYDKTKIDSTKDINRVVNIIEECQRSSSESNSCLISVARLVLYRIIYSKSNQYLSLNPSSGFRT